MVAPLFGLTICRTGKRCFFDVVFLGSVIPGPNPHCDWNSRSSVWKMEIKHYSQTLYARALGASLTSELAPVIVHCHSDTERPPRMPVLHRLCILLSAMIGHYDGSVIKLSACRQRSCIVLHSYYEDGRHLSFPLSTLLLTGSSSPASCIFYG